MKYVVTGGAGFIGSNIVSELLEQGHEVIVLDDFSSGKKENLNSKATLVEGSVSDLNLLKKTFEGVDFVLHQAAIPSVPDSISDPLGSHNVNITGGLYVLIAARDAGVKKVVFASSSAVYGNEETFPLTEELPTVTISPYGFGKLAMEQYARLFYELYGLQYTGLRYFNVFGPRQDPKSKYAAVIPIFINLMKNDTQPTMFGDGEQTRDFVFVQDVVQANIKASQNDANGVFNIGSGNKISLNLLVKELNTIMGKNIVPIYGPIRKGDIVHSFANIDKAKKELNYDPKVTLSDGLKKTVEWYS